MNKTPKLRFKEFSGDWKTHVLGKSITLYDNERKPVKEQERNSGEYAYYGATGIIDYIDNYIFEGEYLLLGEDGANIVTRNAPLIYKTEGQFWVNNHAHIFKPTSKFDIDFMKQRLELINYIPYNTGTAQPKLNADSIKSIPFNAPSKGEQEKIASFFSLIDDKISLQGDKVEALKDYKKGMMQKIFSRELRFKDDDGRDYPEWNKMKMGDITVKVGPKNKENKSYEVYSINNKVGFIPQNEQFEDSRLDHLDKSLYKIINKGEFAYNPARINVGSIGVLEEDKTVIVSSLYVCFKFIKNIDYRFFKQYFSYPQFNKDVIRNTEGSVREYLFYENFSNIKVNIPCLEEQNKISKLLEQLDMKIKHEEDKLDYLSEYKKGLLQQMFV